jgi:hypothetical protein
LAGTGIPDHFGRCSPDSDRLQLDQQFRQAERGGAREHARRLHTVVAQALRHHLRRVGQEPADVGDMGALRLTMFERSIPASASTAATLSSESATCARMSPGCCGLPSDDVVVWPDTKTPSTKALNKDALVIGLVPIERVQRSLLHSSSSRAPQSGTTAMTSISTCMPSSASAGTGIRVIAGLASPQTRSTSSVITRNFSRS